jgi:predicted nuclease of restriction endonuclease-like (RecB) superfamily
MKQFYETYKDFEKLSPLVTQLSWTNNLLILSGAKTIEEKEFYIKMALKNKYSKRELDRQISTAYFERYMVASDKANQSITKTIDEDDYPNTRILDTYTLEFLDLPNNYKEKDLQSAIVDNMKDFILEIGKDFTFMDKEYKVQVGNHDFFIDLLFYNRAFSCLVAFELKIGEFKPEYISKMDLYLEALDRQEKKQNENPSVGIILCSNKDEKVVEFAMSRSTSPTLVAQYKTELIDKKLLQDKLKQITDILQEPTETEGLDN